MKAIKLIILFYFALGSIQCKKDAKVEPIFRILEDGKYLVLLEFISGGKGYENYFIKENCLYSTSVNANGIDTTCFERKAGNLIFNENGGIIITPIQMNNGSNNPCMFYSDVFGGDTLILHFFNIYEFYDNSLRKGLKGNFYYNVPSNLPFSKHEGSFTLGFKPKQQ